MIDKIRYSSLRPLLEDHKWLLVSYENYIKKVEAGVIDLCLEIFNDNEDYRLSSFAASKESIYFRTHDIYINFYQRKALYIKIEDFYYKEIYEVILKAAKIKVDPEHLEGLKRIANGL